MKKTGCNLMAAGLCAVDLFTGVKRVVAVFAFIAIVLSMTSLTANGQTVTYNGTISSTTLGNSATTTLPEFNSALGTLTGVQVTLDFTATPYAEVFNFSGVPQIFSTNDWASSGFNPANTWTISYGTDSWNLAVPTVTTGTIFGTGQSVPTFPGNLTLVGGTSAPADLTGASGLDFAAYTGAGDLVFGTTGTGNYAGSGEPFFFGGGADLGGTASVTYDFVPVPEPTTAGCFLLGLGALACYRRFIRNLCSR
jgi:hypothetical protein